MYTMNVPTRARQSVSSHASLPGASRPALKTPPPPARRRPDPVAGAVDDVVGAPLVVDPPLLVRDAEVAGEEPLAPVGGPGGLRAVPVAEHDDGIAAPHRDDAELARGENGAVLAEDGDRVAGIRSAQGRGARRDERVVLADEDVRLRLPVDLVDPEAEALLDPRADLGRDLLAAAEHAAQPEPEPLRLVDRDGDLPEGGGGEEGVRHAPARHQLERAGGIEAGRRRPARDAGGERAEEADQEAPAPPPARGGPPER